MCAILDIDWVEKTIVHHPKNFNPKAGHDLIFGTYLSPKGWNPFIGRFTPLQPGAQGNPIKEEPISALENAGINLFRKSQGNPIIIAKTKLGVFYKLIMLKLKK